MPQTHSENIKDYELVLNPKINLLNSLLVPGHLLKYISVPTDSYRNILVVLFIKAMNIFFHFFSAKVIQF